MTNIKYNRNTNPSIYYGSNEINLNCGSFALEVDEWYTPYAAEGPDYSEMEREDWICSLLEEGCSREEIMSYVVEADFAFILDSCPWLEQISYEDIDFNDRVIAYRLSFNDVDCAEDFDSDLDTDFHFRVLIDGEWYEKNGGGPVHLADQDILAKWVIDDWLVYDSDIKFARFKEVCA